MVIVFTVQIGTWRDASLRWEKHTVNSFKYLYGGGSRRAFSSNASLPSRILYVKHRNVPLSSQSATNAEHILQLFEWRREQTCVAIERIIAVENLVRQVEKERTLIKLWSSPSSSSSFQMHCLAAWSHFPFRTGEDIGSYRTRRGIALGKLLNAHGRWSQKWAEAILNWHQHCIRSRDFGFFLGDLLQHQTISVIDAARIEASGEAAQSRTRTRAYHGNVTRRFESSVQEAKKYLDSIGSRPSTKNQHKIFRTFDEEASTSTVEIRAMRAFQEFEDFPLELIFE